MRDLGRKQKLVKGVLWSLWLDEWMIQGFDREL